MLLSNFTHVLGILYASLTINPCSDDDIVFSQLNISFMTDSIFVLIKLITLISSKSLYISFILS